MKLTQFLNNDGNEPPPIEPTGDVMPIMSITLICKVCKKSWISFNTYTYSTNTDDRKRDTTITRIPIPTRLFTCTCGQVYKVPFMHPD